MNDLSRVRSSEASLVPTEDSNKKVNEKDTNTNKLLLKNKNEQKDFLIEMIENSTSSNQRHEHYGNNALWIFSNHNRFRRFLQKIVSHKYFSILINCLILVNSLFLIFETIPSLSHITKVTNIIFAILYGIECIMKIIAYGFILDSYTYLRDAWNWLDFIVVISEIIYFIPGIPGKVNMLSVRTFRLIRPLKSISFLPTMRMFISTLISSMIDLSTIYLIMLFFFMIFAILGLTLWTETFHYRCRTISEPINDTFPISPKYADVLCGGKVKCDSESYCRNSMDYYPDKLSSESIFEEETMSKELHWGLVHFGDIGHSLFVVFLTTTGEAWPDIMKMYMDGFNYFVSIIYFVLCVVINYYFTINLSVAAMLYNFENAKQVNLSPLAEKKKSKWLATLTLDIIDAQHINETNLINTYRLKYTPIDTISSKSKLNGMQCNCVKITCFERILPQTEYHLKFRFGFMCYFIYMQPLTQYFFYCCIIINIILLAFDRVDIGDQEFRVIDICNITLVSIFVFEIILLMFAVGLYKFVRSIWNLIDTFIIFFSLIIIIIQKQASHEISHAANTVINILQMLRVIRLVKLLRKWQQFKIISGCITQTVIRMINYLFIFIIFIFMYTLLGYSGFHEGLDHLDYNFDSFISSLISVFRVIIGDHWQDIFYSCYQSIETSTVLAYIYFITLIFFGQITLLNLFIAYFIDNFQRTKKQYERNITVFKYLMNVTHFRFREHDMETRTTKVFHQKRVKTDIKVLNKYMQKLQKKEIISEGEIIFLNKIKIDFVAFKTDNEMYLSHDHYSFNTNNIKVMFFEKVKNSNGLSNPIDEFVNEFHDLSYIYNQKPDFSYDKSLIEKVADVFVNKNTIEENDIPSAIRSQSSPQLKNYKPSNRYEKAQPKSIKPIFSFDSISSGTIHQSVNEEEKEEAIQSVESFRPLKIKNKSCESMSRQSDSIIDNDSNYYYIKANEDNNTHNDKLDSIDIESQLSKRSEPKIRHRLSIISTDRSRVNRFRTTMQHRNLFKRRGCDILKITTGVEKVEEETDESSNKEDVLVKPTGISNRGTNFKERFSPIWEYMKYSSLFIFHRDWKIRKIIRILVYNKYFNYTIFALIICNCVVMCFDNPWLDPDSKGADAIYGLHIFFNIVFIIEGFLKIVSDNFVYQEREDITNFNTLKYVIENNQDSHSNISGTNDPTSLSTSFNSANISWNKMNLVAKEKFITKANQIMRKRKSYLCDPANILDFICIIFSILDMSITQKLSYLKVLRIFRAIKPIRIFTKSENLQMMVNCLWQSLPSIANVLIVSCFFIFIFGVMGVSIFKKALQYYCTNIIIRTKEECLLAGEHWYKNPHNFDNFAISLKTNFLIMLADDWGTMMARAGHIFDHRWVYWYYVIYVIIGYLFILNLLVSVIIQNFRAIKQKEINYKSLTLPEKEWIHVQKMMVKVRPKYEEIIDPLKTCQLWMNDMVKSVWLNNSILIMIGLGVFFLLLQYDSCSDVYYFVLDIFSYIFTFIFNIEIIIKISVSKKQFFMSSFWNSFDLFLLILCDAMVILNILTFCDIVDLRALSSLPFILRSFRILRALRMISSFSRLRSVIDTLFYLVPSIANVGIILFLLIFIYANIGMNVFGTIPHRSLINDNMNFRNIISSALLLFQVATKDNVGEVLNEISYHDCRDPLTQIYQEDLYCFKYNVVCFDDDLVTYTSMNDSNMFSCGSDFSYFYIISFVLLGPLFIMNLCIVMVIEGFDESMKDNEGLFTRDYIEQFIGAWIKYDVECKKMVKPHEFALIMKEIQPTLGFNYDGIIENLSLLQQRDRDRVNAFRELAKLMTFEKKKTTISLINERKYIKKGNNCYIFKDFYLSGDLKNYTNDREVLLICNKLNIPLLDPSPEIKQNDIKEPISIVEPIDAINKEYYIHFIDACLILSRLSVCKMMNVQANKLRINAVGTYTKKTWNKKYKQFKDVINAFFEPKKQRDKISPILATKLLYNKMLKKKIQKMREKMKSAQYSDYILQSDVVQRPDQSIIYPENPIMLDTIENQTEENELDQIIKNDFLRVSKRKHTGTCNMSYFHNMKQLSLDPRQLDNKQNIIQLKMISPNQQETSKLQDRKSSFAPL